MAYQYDSLNRPVAAIDRHRMQNLTTSYSYDGIGNLANVTLPNGAGVNYTYDALNRLNSMGTTLMGNTIASYNYKIGAGGNRTSVLEFSSRAVTWSYDDLYRLISETVTNDPHTVNGGVTYGFDGVGNRQTRNSSLIPIPAQTFTGAYDQNDRLTATGYTYDNDGNTLTDPAGNSFVYDSLDRMTQATVNGTTINYVYDGDGNRVSKTIGGVTTNYLVDTNNLTGFPQVVDELQSGTVKKVYTYGSSLISQDLNLGPSIWSLSYFGKDGQGSTRFLMDSTGTITDTYDYDAFGNLINQTHTGTPTDNVYLYDGEQFDLDLGQYYLRARYMNPVIGRFQTMDSFEGDNGDPLSLHKFIFASNNPVVNIDPGGNDDGGMSNAPHVFWSSLAHDLEGTIRINVLPISEPLNDGKSCGFLLNAHALTVNRLPKFNVYRWVQRVKTDIPYPGQPKDQWYFDGLAPGSPNAIAQGFPQGSPWPLLYPTIAEQVLQKADNGNARFRDQSSRPRILIDKNGGSCHWEAQAFLVGLDNWNTTSFNTYIGEMDWGWNVTRAGSIYNVTAKPIIFNYLY